ncbi:lantibiotic dehydratase [Spongiactinospora sp. TRM90649]|uniref:lantibiotic dehydratase n=1 Tax=Spongiactinospora sp. TRM90649 TaxID=3031114 RepID=UPI0023F9C011|nr:lantibiotic dehydratase [Spongiactinospora sp. TRM90649]MDF5758818.1 lantibiotic dehydratase [Spongiactinospora sp. TRM90649]
MIGWVDWLRKVWATPEVADTLAHASPALDERVRALLAMNRPEARATRRAVLSVARYVRRMTGRPTPVGLLAGVAPATFAEQPFVRWGSGHRAVARADAGWLADVIGSLEGCPALLERLAVVVNSMAIVRGDRLIVPHQPKAPVGEGRVGTVEVSLRYTDAVRTAIEAARTPVAFGKLVALLVTTFPAVAPAKATEMLTALVARRALITSLHAPGTEPDALGWILAHLEELDGAAVPSVAPVIGDLREIHRLLDRHSKVSVRQSRAIRAHLNRRMRGLAFTHRHPVAVDLRWDASIVLPAAVARESERAARALARLSAHPFGEPAWSDFHRRFYQRFGVGALVPLLDVVADSGIGWPDGYPGAPNATRPAARSGRDETLLALAQTAALDGRYEVVLDEPLIAELEQGTPGKVRLPLHLELCVRIHAADLDALQRGDFRLTMVSVSRAAGVVSGRFLTVLDQAGRAELVSGLARLPGSNPDTVCAQLTFPPLDPATAHVVRTLRALPSVISFAEHRDSVTDPNILTAEDLAVGCDGHRLYLAVPAWGKRVEAWALHALNLRTHTPPLARFVTEISRAQSVQVTDFDWGAAGQLPFLPRLRHGRTILSPARWRLGAGELPRRTAGWKSWEAALAEWCARRRLPRLVYLVVDDQRLPLDLDDAGHRVLLHEHMNTQLLAVLEEAPDEQAAGWCEGRAHEVVVPLAAAQPPRWPRLPRPVRQRIVGRDYGCMPGASRVLCAELYGEASRQDTVLAQHLPALLARWGDTWPVWWFLRFRDRGECRLRLRIILPTDTAESFGQAAGAVSAWADELRRGGLLRDVAYATSYPQTGRWGGGHALNAAQTAFAADSAAVLTQLALPVRPKAQALAAANFVAMTIAFTGGISDGLAWLLRCIPATAPAPVPRPVFTEAVRLADPHDDFFALRGVPGGTAIVDAWTQRAEALTAYRTHFPGPDTTGIQADDALDSLLHTHFLRASGIAPKDKSVCLYLARAAALAATARTQVRP